MYPSSTKKTGVFPVTPESAEASELFDLFIAASTFKSVLHHYRHMCHVLKIKPTNIRNFYPKLKNKLKSWRAQALWGKFDRRASHKCYNHGKACHNTKVLIIGCGPCGLRAAIEAQLLGAKVVVVEKRDRFSRNSVLHLWPFVIADLKALGAKKLYGKFCAGSIDHISIRQMQCILLKVALLLGVEVFESVTFEELLEPPEDQNEKFGWHARFTPSDHSLHQYDFDVLIGADGKRNTLHGFKRKEFRGKLAIAITANFINRHTEAEACVEDLPDTQQLLHPNNVDSNALQAYAREAADFSTNYLLPSLDFAVNHYGKPDVAMFDFTSMFAAENACRCVERRGHKLLLCLVGDSLLEPFWPTGSGCARGFLGSFDAAWAMCSWASGKMSILEVLAERESIYRLLAQTTPENLSKDHSSYAIDPTSRYPTINLRAVLPFQVRNLYNTDDSSQVEKMINEVSVPVEHGPKKRKRRDSLVHPETLLNWCRKQVALYTNVRIENMTTSFKDGRILCAIIHRYRPDLIDFNSLKPEAFAENNQLAFDILEKEFGVPQVMTGEEIAECSAPDKLSMISYLSHIYDTFRGEVPHYRHSRLDQIDLEGKVISSNVLKNLSNTLPDSECFLQQSKLPSLENAAVNRVDSSRLTCRLYDSDLDKKLKNKKRRSERALEQDDALALERHEEIFANRMERMQKQKAQRELNAVRFIRSMQLLQSDGKSDRVFVQSSYNPSEDIGLSEYRKACVLSMRDRAKELERKIYFSDQLAYSEDIKTVASHGGQSEEIADKAKGLDTKFSGSIGQHSSDKKPKDLIRSIGRIEKSDWNVAIIEKRIAEDGKLCLDVNKTKEKVPKYNRDVYNEKFHTIEKRLRGNGEDEETIAKYRDIDATLKRLELKHREGSTLEVGLRGHNKVSNLASQLSSKWDKKDSAAIPVSRSNSRPMIALSLNGSDLCHFCGTRVYLVERLSAEGKFFHRQCFKCEYCGAILRLGNYIYDREGRFGGKFFCIPHYGLTPKNKSSKKMFADIESIKENVQIRAPHNISKSLMHGGMSSLVDKLANRSAPHIPSTLNTGVAQPYLGTSVLEERGTTPERVEFENSVVEQSDEEEYLSEEEWTDRNFGTSANEVDNSDVEDSDECSEMSEEEIGEKAGEGLDANRSLTAEETRKLAESWKRRYSADCLENLSGDSDIDSDIDSEECDADGDDSRTATEGEVEDDEDEDGEDVKKAREQRRLELNINFDAPPRKAETSDSGSGTEIVSGEEIEENDTQIDTDSEFADDRYMSGSPKSIPTIVINETSESAEAINLDATVFEKEVSLQELDTAPAVTKADDEKSTSLTNLKEIGISSFKTEQLKRLLQRTEYAEAITSKKNLLLKKEYLLGRSSNLPRKSASTVDLGSKFKTFMEKISETQKMLNPAPHPSPAMQVFMNAPVGGISKTPISSPLFRPLSSTPLNSIANGNLFNKSESFCSSVNKVQMEALNFDKIITDKLASNDANVLPSVVVESSIHEDKKDSLSESPSQYDNVSPNIPLFDFHSNLDTHRSAAEENTDKTLHAQLPLLQDNAEVQESNKNSLDININVKTGENLQDEIVCANKTNIFASLKTESANSSNFKTESSVLNNNSINIYLSEDEHFQTCDLNCFIPVETVNDYCILSTNVVDSSNEAKNLYVSSYLPSEKENIQVDSMSLLRVIDEAVSIPYDSSSSSLQGNCSGDLNISDFQGDVDTMFEQLANDAILDFQKQQNSKESKQGFQSNTAVKVQNEFSIGQNSPCDKLFLTEVNMKDKSSNTKNIEKIRVENCLEIFDNKNTATKVNLTENLKIDNKEEIEKSCSLTSNDGKIEEEHTNIVCNDKDIIITDQDLSDLAGDNDTGILSACDLLEASSSLTLSLLPRSRDEVVRKASMESLGDTDSAISTAPPKCFSVVNSDSATVSKDFKSLENADGSGFEDSSDSSTRDPCPEKEGYVRLEQTPDSPVVSIPLLTRHKGVELASNDSDEINSQSKSEDQSYQSNSLSELIESENCIIDHEINEKSKNLSEPASFTEDFMTPNLDKELNKSLDFKNEHILEFKSENTPFNDVRDFVEIKKNSVRKPLFTPAKVHREERLKKEIESEIDNFGYSENQTTKRRDSDVVHQMVLSKIARKSPEKLVKRSSRSSLNSRSSSRTSLFNVHSSPEPMTPPPVPKEPPPLDDESSVALDSISIEEKIKDTDVPFVDEENYIDKIDRSTSPAAKIKNLLTNTKSPSKIVLPATPLTHPEQFVSLRIAQPDLHKTPSLPALVVSPTKSFGLTPLNLADKIYSEHTDKKNIKENECLGNSSPMLTAYVQESYNKNFKGEGHGDDSEKVASQTPASNKEERLKALIAERRKKDPEGCKDSWAEKEDRIKERLEEYRQKRVSAGNTINFDYAATSSPKENILKHPRPSYLELESLQVFSPAKTNRNSFHTEDLICQSPPKVNLVLLPPKVDHSQSSSKTNQSQSSLSPSRPAKNICSVTESPSPQSCDNKKFVKKSKDRERRRSLIQVFAGMFAKSDEKKKASNEPQAMMEVATSVPRIVCLSDMKQTPPKSPTVRERFAKLRLSRSKDKSKMDTNRSSSVDAFNERDTAVSPTIQNYAFSLPTSPRHLSASTITSSASSSSSIKMFTNTLLPQKSEESCSEDEATSQCSTLERGGCVAGANASLRKQKAVHKAARQAELKRLRMAQEIQRQQEECEVKTRELEERGVEVEKRLRGEIGGVIREEGDLMNEWFNLVHEKNALLRRGQELSVRAQELELEDRHVRLENELRQRMGVSESDKLREDIEKEGLILSEMLKILELKDVLANTLEEDKRRYQEEDRDLEAFMAQKGIHFVPIRRETGV